jgi:hypothetical protein
LVLLSVLGQKIRRLARDFVPRQGLKAQEYFVYFKLSNRSIGAKDPPRDQPLAA